MTVSSVVPPALTLPPVNVDSSTEWYSAPTRILGRTVDFLSVSTGNLSGFKDITRFVINTLKAFVYFAQKSATSAAALISKHFSFVRKGVQFFDTLLGIDSVLQLIPGTAQHSQAPKRLDHKICQLIQAISGIVGGVLGTTLLLSGFGFFTLGAAATTMGLTSAISFGIMHLAKVYKPLIAAIEGKGTAAKQAQNILNIQISLLSSVASGLGMLISLPVLIAMGAFNGALSLGRQIVKYNAAEVKSVETPRLATAASLPPVDVPPHGFGVV